MALVARPQAPVGHFWLAGAFFERRESLVPASCLRAIAFLAGGRFAVFLIAEIGISKDE
jgi:hypothetical protein